MLHGFPLGHLLGHRTHLAKRDQLAGSARHARPGVFQTKLKCASEVTLGDVEFVVGDAIFEEQIKLFVDEAHDLGGVHRLGARIDGERSSIGIRGGTAVHAVRKPTTLADLVEQST